MRILSDCNSVFISHMLSGARASTLPSQIITNHAEFVRVKGSQVRPPPLTPRAPRPSVCLCPRSLTVSACHFSCDRDCMM